MKINIKNIFLQNAEFFVWLFFIFSISSSSLVQFIFFKRLSLEIMSDFVFIAFILLIPILTKIVYNKWPLRLIVDNIQRYQVVQGDGSTSTIILDNASNMPFDNISIEDSKRAEKYLAHLALSSRLLSERIYKSANVYLLIGGVIAIGGIIFVITYTMQTDVIIKAGNVSLWTSFLPRFGGLIFIEFIAFFFLKQYRVTMTEFSSYEEIKRQRESNLFLFRLFEFYEKESEPFDKIIQSGKFFEKQKEIKSNDNY